MIISGNDEYSIMISSPPRGTAPTVDVKTTLETLEQKLEKLTVRWEKLKEDVASLLTAKDEER